MAYKVAWIVPHHVLYTSLSEDVRLEDFRESSRLTGDMMDEAYASGSASIIIGIIDLTHARMSQLMRSVITSAQEIYDQIDPRMWTAKPGFVVLVTVSESAKLLTSLVIRISKQPMTTVGTLEEAMMVVRYMYPELQEQLDEYLNSDRQVGTSSSPSSTGS